MPAEKLGKPCWNIENVDQAIKIAARTDEEGVDYFLASHAPVNNIQHDETEETFNEETLFHSLFTSKSEVLSLIHGDPGSGKSHLIHWLKLRTEDALNQRELKKFRPILIQRRTGSLRDALEQMIEQLGEDFRDYISDVQQALSKISADTAREKLINNIGIELRPQQRIDRNRKPLPKSLEDISKLCIGSQGFRDWLCRENGVGSAVIKHLTETHISEDGIVATEQGLPKFNSKELLPDAIYRKITNNTQYVSYIIAEFEEFPEIAEEVADYFNEVLPDAIKELTGLSGTNLRDIFDRIRKDLKKRGETLALFIEDVSVMSALDEEVFTAVEPQTRKDLCRMIAVLGSTNEGWNRLPDNQKQRVTHPISLGEKAVVAWKDDQKSVAEFAARYLNTVRLTSKQIGEVAEQRRKTGKDITISACDYCQVREKCHSIFGKSQIGEIVVGMFPLTVVAPQRLLNNLSDKSVMGKNARGLLTQILYPTLDNGFTTLEEKNFPHTNKYVVSLPPISFWTGFKQKYCGNWRDSEINRLEFIAKGWFNAANADDLASQLSPILEPFGFHEFSKKTSPIDKPKLPIQFEQTKQEIPKRVEPTVSKKLDKILKSLADWLNGEKLQEDREIRTLIADLIRNSINWDDFTSLPLETWKSLIGVTKHAFVKIEDQIHSPQTTPVFIDFLRNEETRNLIEALAQFRYSGNSSWDFEHGEHHKRVVAQWLRHNQTQIVEQLQPPKNLAIDVPVNSAVQILSTISMIRQRKKLPSELHELLKSVLDDKWDEEPVALSKEWSSLLKDMQLKHEDFLRFLNNELNVPQGRTGGINYINPIPALNAVLDFATEPKIEIPGEEYFKSHWKGRFGVFENKNKYNEFAKALEAERQEIAIILETIETNLKRVEYNADNLPLSLITFCEDLTELIKAQKDAKMPHPYNEFDVLMSRKVFIEKKDVWHTAVKTAQEVVKDNEFLSILRFDPSNLKEADESINIALKYVSIIENDVANDNERFKKEGDPDVLVESLLETLEKIESLDSK